MNYYKLTQVVLPKASAGPDVVFPPAENVNTAPDPAGGCCPRNSRRSSLSLNKNRTPCLTSRPCHLSC